MPAVNAMLGLVGLATRRQLDHAIDRKDRWHGLVRNVFAPYYLKFQETSLGSMPELPLRYSQDWERYIRGELDDFMSLDLESVGDLLDAAGFGTEKWERLQEDGFRGLGRLMDRVVEGDDLDSNGHISADDIDAAVREDLQQLMSQHPDAVQQIVERIDLDTGLMRLTEDDVAGSEPYRQLVNELDGALVELRRFRRGGQRALERIRQLEAQLAFGNGSGSDETPELGGSLGVSFDELDDEREVAVLGKELRAREVTISSLRDQLEQLEGQLEVARRDPDELLEARIAELEAELEDRDAQVVRQQEHLERLQDEVGDQQPVVADESDEIRQLRADLKARDHRLETLAEELEQARAELTAQGPPEGKAQEDLGERVHSLEGELRAREHDIESLQERLQEAEQRLFETETVVDDDGGEDKEAIGSEPAEAPPGELQDLRNDLKAREHTIETLQEQITKLEADVERVTARSSGTRDTSPEPEPGSAAPTPVRPSGPDPEQEKELETLRRDLRAREHTITALRGKLEDFEKELGEARERLVAEVRRLSALTSGELELKPSEELDAMDADGLLSYAREVAEDLDVRRQTLDEGLQGIDSVKDSYEDTRKVFEQQQTDMESQLEELRSEVDTFRGLETSGDGSSNEMRETINKQRQQLELLATRVRQLVDTNKDLNDSNKKMYENMESAVKKVIPLRRQIDELENLSEALQRFIRHKHDRTFTIRKLEESGIT